MCADLFCKKSLCKHLIVKKHNPQEVEGRVLLRRYGLIDESKSRVLSNETGDEAEVSALNIFLLL